MFPHPVVRHMLLCRNWGRDPNNNERLNVLGLMSSIRSGEDPPYPLLVEEFCVVLILTDGRGAGEGQIICVHEDTGQEIFGTSKRTITFADPLELLGVPFRVRDCPFPTSGLYSIQFWYEGEMLAECPLLMR